MIEAAGQRDSTRQINPPLRSTDDDLGMAWWNALSEQDRRYWMRLAGDTGRAVDAWEAFKGVHLSDPRDVLTDLFEEELLPDPAAMADLVIQRLRDAGFEIKPINTKEMHHHG